MLAHLTRGVERPLSLETHVLVAAKDGYWQGRGRDEVRAVIERYVAPKTVTFKDASHLWVVAPENATELLEKLESPSAGGGVT